MRGIILYGSILTSGKPWSSFMVVKYRLQRLTRTLSWAFLSQKSVTNIDLSPPYLTYDLGSKRNF